MRRPARRPPAAPRSARRPAPARSSAARTARAEPARDAGRRESSWSPVARRPPSARGTPGTGRASPRAPGRRLPGTRSRPTPSVDRVLDHGADQPGRDVGRPAARPSPKCAASVMPLVSTLIASAVDSVPVGTLSVVRPSAVTPSAARGTPGPPGVPPPAPAARPAAAAPGPARATRRLTISISTSALSGSGSTTVLNRRFSALDISLMPRSRSFAVATSVKPATACTSSPARAPAASSPTGS